MAQDQETLSKEERKRIDKALLNLVNSEFDKKKVEQENIELRRLVIKAFDAYDLKSYTLSEVDEAQLYKHPKSKKPDEVKPNSTVRVTMIKKSMIYYDLVKIKEKLNRHLVRMFTHMRREITDYGSFKMLMKEYKVPYSKVKKCINETETIDTGKLENLYKIGEVNIKDLVGCYTVSEGEAYLKLTVVNDKSPME
jgi:hypothetical protein